MKTMKALLLLLACAFQGSLVSARSPQRLYAKSHGKPFEGPSEEKSGRLLKIEGQTDWQKYNEGQSDEFIVTDLIVTIETNAAWDNSDKPQWFVAFPSSEDDPASTRDYVIIKGSYEYGLRTDPDALPGAAETYFQTAEYYQQKDPNFEPVRGNFDFIDNGGIYSKQVAERHASPIATNSL